MASDIEKAATEYRLAGDRLTAEIAKKFPRGARCVILRKNGAQRIRGTVASVGNLSSPAEINILLDRSGKLTRVHYSYVSLL